METMLNPLLPDDDGWLDDDKVIQRGVTAAYIMKDGVEYEVPILVPAAELKTLTCRPCGWESAFLDDAKMVAHASIHKDRTEHNNWSISSKKVPCYNYEQYSKMFQGKYEVKCPLCNKKSSIVLTAGEGFIKATAECEVGIQLLHTFYIVDWL